MRLFFLSHSNFYVSPACTVWPRIAILILDWCELAGLLNVARKGLQEIFIANNNGDMVRHMKLAEALIITLTEMFATKIRRLIQDELISNLC